MRKLRMEGFRAWLMSEMTKNVAKDLQQWMDGNDLPFKDLFSNERETRAVIPFFVDPEAKSILDKIKQSGMEINFQDGTITHNNRAMRLGKYILNKKSPFTEQEKAWWNHSGNAIKELQEVGRKDDYMIIISRSPIDIVRMSDHDGWTSCHNPSREYFACAISDAKGSGAIAYVIKKEDLKHIKDLQAAEIFADPERHITGIKPVSRIRLRRFVNKEHNEFDLAVPEDRVYGLKIPGVDESVRKWVLEKQMPKIKKYGSERPRLHDFNLVGGSYQDTMGSDLFNYLFDDEYDSGDADYAGEEEGQNMADQMEDEVEIIERHFRNVFKICSYHVSVEETEGHPYVHYMGWVNFRMPKNLMLPVKSDPDGVKWNERPSYKNKKAIKDWANENNIYASEVEIDGNEINLSIDNENGDLDPDGFRGFLNELRNIEREKDKLEGSLYELLVGLGLAKSNRATYISHNIDDHPHQFTHFEWDNEDSGARVELKSQIEMPSNNHAWGDMRSNFVTELKKNLVAWGDRIVAAERQQGHLFGQPEIRKPFSGEFRIDPEIWFGASRGIGKIVLKMAIDLHPLAQDEHVDDALAFIGFLDKNYERFEKLVLDTWNKVLKVHGV